MVTGNFKPEILFQLEIPIKTETRRNSGKDQNLFVLMVTGNFEKTGYFGCYRKRERIQHEQQLEIANGAI